MTATIVDTAVTKTSTREDVISTLKAAMSDAHSQYAHLSDTKTRSVPAGPNSSHFRATQSAMIELRDTAMVSRSSFAQKISPALIVGSLHGPETSREIYEKMIEAVRSQHPDVEIEELHEGLRFRASDEYVTIYKIYGSNYSTIGIDAGAA